VPVSSPPEFELISGTRDRAARDAPASPLTRKDLSFFLAFFVNPRSFSRCFLKQLWVRGVTRSHGIRVLVLNDLGIIGKGVILWF